MPLNKILLYCIILLVLQCEGLNAGKLDDYDYVQDQDEFTFLIAGGQRQKSIQRKYTKYMVSIRSREATKFFGDNHFCAGTIIGKNLILTAAHCVMDKRKVLTRPRRLLVVAGSPNRLRRTNTTVELPVAAVKANLNFILDNIHDIALIYLKVSIPTNNKNIKIMPLPDKPPPYGERCIAIGWGRMFYNGPLAATVTHIEVDLFTPDACEQSHPRFVSDVLCTNDSTYYHRDPCRGDSGGPLFCGNVLTGIISYTLTCGGHARYPSLYTGVYGHLDWIKKYSNNAKHMQVSLYLLSVLVMILYIHF